MKLELTQYLERIDMSPRFGAQSATVRTVSEKQIGVDITFHTTPGTTYAGIMPVSEFILSLWDGKPKTIKLTLEIEQPSELTN
jgi:hypothetical protein